MRNTVFRYPSPEEMSALTAAAHRARARNMRLLVRRGVHAVKSLALRFTAVPAVKRVSHA